jgi:UDP-N-acetylglucosamine 1-carboxyvinyltransferase
VEKSQIPHLKCHISTKSQTSLSLGICDLLLGVSARIAVVPHDIRYKIEGITPLRGEVTLSGSKNAALPCMCAALLTKEEVILHNVPEIADVYTLLEIFTFLGVQYEFANHTLKVKAEDVASKTIPHALVGKMRASILLLGPILARCGEVELSYPGGCVIGKRPVDAHIDVLVQLGAKNHSDQDTIRLRGAMKGGDIVLPEFSVTATENILLAAASSGGETVIHIAAAEPHVQDLCRLLRAMGTCIEGIGTHDVRIRGAHVRGAEHVVTTDYLEAGFFALAGVLTGGDVKICGVQSDQLVSFFKAMTQLNAPWTLEDDMLHVHGGTSLRACRIKTNIFPGFPTDLQAAFGVAMTQANGVSRIFERMYEGRNQGYLFELEKMGAHVEMMNPYEALVIGPTPLKGHTVASNDIRAGAGMVLAALCARGETLITDVQYIERGYENLPAKLRNLGASIVRLEGDRVESSHHGNDSTQRLHNPPVRKQDGVIASLS